MSKPMVSVIVTLYNAHRHIKKCVDSILAQTLRSFEIILVDDASTDGSFEFCRELYGENVKIKFIRHAKTVGAGVARNVAMQYAAGKYVCFVNGEDFVLPSALKKFYTAAEKSDADVVQAAGRFELTQEDSEPVRKENLRLKWDNYSREGLLDSRLLYKLEEHWKKGTTNLHATLCFCRREFLAEKHITFLDIAAADETFIFALMCLTERYYILRAPFYIKRNTTAPIDADKKFSDGLRSMVVGSIYIEKFLDKIPHFNNYELWRENLLAAFFYRTFKEFTAPHYKNLLTDADLNLRADSAMAPFFPNGKSFAKYFFNGFHAFRIQAAISARERDNFSAQVTDLFKRIEISDRKIVFVTDDGYARDAKYIAEEILRQDLPCDLIWIVRDANAPLPKKIRKVIHGSIDSTYELATAKIVVTDATEPHIFSDKKDGQFFIATYDAEPFTRLESDVEKNLATSAAQFDFMIANTREQFNELRDAFNYAGKILTCGLPRNDLFFRRDDKFTAKIRKTLNVPRFSKIVMYAPTDVCNFDAKKLLDVLEKKFGGEWTLLTRLPPIVPADIFGKSDNIIAATNYPDVQELIFVADVLIADYSPMILDFMLCDKPIFRLAKDFDDFTSADDFKPLYFDLPGKINRTDAELFADIETFDDAAYSQKVNDFMSKVEPFDKGHAAEEIVAIISSVIANS